MKDIIKNYEKAKQEIYAHVGFKEDYVVYPIDDCTDKYWDLFPEFVKYADSYDQLVDLDNIGDLYEDEIYTQRFYKKHVYEGKDYTMIFCDPNVDGMKWFRIFDNKKRVNLGV